MLSPLELLGEPPTLRMERAAWPGSACRRGEGPVRLSPSDFGGGCCCPPITSGQAEVQKRGTCPGSHCQLQVRGWEAVRMTVVVEGLKVLGLGQAPQVGSCSRDASVSL